MGAVDKREGEGAKANGVVRFVIEVVLAIWAVVLMGYFYYDKGYVDLMGQLLELAFG